MKTQAAVLLLALAGAARADGDVVRVCFNYGCASEEPVQFSEQTLAWVRQLLLAAGSAERERELLALAVGRLYARAGEQTPISADKGGNQADEGVEGRMDCIDHSTTTTRFLRLIEDHGWLRFHHVLEPARRVRFLVFQHFSAQIEEIRLPGTEPLDTAISVVADDGIPDAPTGPRFVVDSWFVDNGKPAVVLPLDDWMNGAGPDE